jgi:hypothetical protein
MMLMLKFPEELSDFENESELEYTDEESFTVNWTLSSIFWCSCKAYTRNRCTLTMQGLRKIRPEAIKLRLSIDITIVECIHSMQYYFGHAYGITVFKNHVIYKSHRYVDSSKW